MKGIDNTNWKKKKKALSFLKSKARNSRLIVNFNHMVPFISEGWFLRYDLDSKLWNPEPPMIIPKL